MSLLPGQILPPSTSLGQVNDNGSVTINHDWWLLLYNLSLQVLGNGTGLPADALIDLQSVDADAIDADAIALRSPLANALVQAIQPSDVVVGLKDLPDLQRALLLAQDALLPDPTPDLQRALSLAQDGLLPDSAPLAQPVSAITVGASPFTYTASFAGSVAITGSVTSINFKRQGTSVATGLTTGVLPVCRFDQLVVTYPGAAPTMTFIPWSSQ